MALTIGYLARFASSFVLLATGIFLLWTGYNIQNLSITMIGWLVSLMGASMETYNEMRRLGEGLGR